MLNERQAILKFGIIIDIIILLEMNVEGVEGKLWYSNNACVSRNRWTELWWQWMHDQVSMFRMIRYVPIDDLFMHMMLI